MADELTVVVTDHLEEDLEWERERLRAENVVLSVHQLKGSGNQAVIRACADADIIVVNMTGLPRAVIEALDRTRLIIRHGIGYDNVDAVACSERGIQLANEPNYCVDDVAEHAVALLLACSRNLFGAAQAVGASVQAGTWDFSSVFPVRRLVGSTVGVVGTGRIGRRVCDRLTSLGVHIIAFDPALPESARVDGVGYVSLDTLLQQSDFITLHAPVTDETRRMIGGAAFSKMKPTAYLINTSRAALVDTDALVGALNAGTIAGAAVDVFDVEPPPADAPLLHAPRCLLTPHMGWASEESAQAIREEIVEDILRWARGRDARYVVNGVYRGTASRAKE